VWRAADARGVCPRCVALSHSIASTLVRPSAQCSTSRSKNISGAVTDNAPSYGGTVSRSERWPHRRHKRRTNHQQINTHRINKAKLKKSAALISTGLPPRRRLRSGQVREQPNNKAGGSTVSENFALRYSTQGVAASPSADAFGKGAGECGSTTH
jgi:hypothetical protein